MKSNRHRRQAYIARIARTLARDDCGTAMPLVAVLGGILVLVTMIVVTNVTGEHRFVDGDRNWEEALHVAESGVDLAVHEIDLGGSVSIVSLPSSPTKDEVIGAAEALAAADPTEVQETPEGDVVVVASDTTGVLYAVGFSPGLEKPAKKRVVFVDYEILPGLVPFSPETALVLDKDTLISGSLVIKGPKGGMQANKKLTLTGQIIADHCVGAGDFEGDIKDIKKVGPPPCPPKADVGKQDPIDLPDMAARDVWVDAEYQLCPNGDVMAGSAHPTSGWTVNVALNPCETGQILDNAAGSPFMGFEMTGSDASRGAQWLYADNQPNNGSFYIYHGSVVVSSSPAKWQVSVVTEADGAMCEKVGGDVVITGNIESLPYGGSDLAFFADRDMEISGNKNAAGLMVAMEQILITGNPSINGMILVADECDTEASFVHESEIAGNPTLRYDGGIDVPWDVEEPGAGGVGVTDIGEL